MFTIGLRRYIVVVVIVLCTVSPGFAKMDIVIDGVPLPADFSPVEAEKAPTFSGIWAGRWDNVRNTVLIVEAVDKKGKARVLYAVADNGQSKGGWVRYDAEIAGDTLTMFGKRQTVTLRKTATGRMQAIYGNGYGFAILSRQDADAFGTPEETVRWTDGEAIFLETDLKENDTNVRLETVLYKPSGKGPFPLAVINHGSTGGGNDPALEKETWENAWLADYLNERGWIVAFPQRRGRGRSDGLYDEGFAADRSKGYTCDPTLSLAGADRALEDLRAAVTALQKLPEVKPEPVLMTGISRGGALSVAYSGLYPEETRGVINFVGGWMGDGCEQADKINQSLLVKGARFPQQTLWLYGRDDLFYSIAHSRSNFEAFRNAGGTGAFFEITVPGENNGHWVLVVPPLWEEDVEAYLGEL